MHNDYDNDDGGSGGGGIYCTNKQFVYLLVKFKQLVICTIYKI